MEAPGGNRVYKAWGRVHKIGAHVRSLRWVPEAGIAATMAHKTLVSYSPYRLSVIILVLTVGFVIVLALVGYGVGPLVVAEAVQGRGFTPLVTYIQKKPPRSIAYVMEYLHSLVRGALLFVGLGGGVLALVVWPPFQHWWDRLQGGAALDVPLPAPRRRRLDTLFITLTGLSGFVAVTAIDLWPISPYTMYSNAAQQTTPIVVHRLYGLSRDEPGLLMPLEREAFGPLGEGGVKGTMVRLAHKPDPGIYRAALAEMLRAYDRMRPWHHGPDIDGLALYALVWERPHPWAMDRDTPHERRLIFELRRSEPGPEG